MMGTYRRLLVLLSIGALVVVALPSISASEIEANAGADQIVRKGSMVSFMGSLNLPDPERTYTISWDFDADLDVDLDGNSTNDAESYDLYLQHVYEVPGCYTATLRIFDDIGNVYVDTVQITVLDNEPPQLEAPELMMGIIREKTWFNFSASDDVDPPESLMWNWSFGDGTSSTESPPTFHVYTDVRVYSCVVRVYDSENASDEMLVLVTTRGDNPPVIDITSPITTVTYVVTDEIEFNCSNTMDEDGDGLAFLWTSDVDGILSTSPVFSGYLTLGDHIITLYVDDGRHNVSEWIEITVIENRPPTPVISSPENDTEVDSIQVVELIGNSSWDPEDVLTFHWISNVDGYLRNEANIEIKLTRANHTITLWVDDGNGHNISTSIGILVKNLRPVVMISSPPNGTIYNLSSTLDFLSTGSYDPEGDPLQYQWDVRKTGGEWVTIGTTPSSSRTFDESGMFEIRLTIQDGHVSNSTQITVTINEGKDEPEDEPGFEWLSAIVAVALVSVIGCRRKRSRSV